MSKVLVIGGSGFLGSHVADELTNKGHDVAVLDIYKSQYINKNQSMIVADILNEEEVNAAIDGKDYVYHFAGVADIKEAQEDPVETVKLNILSTVYILDACRKFKIKRFLYASTIYVYSEHGSFYRSSKQASELLIENYLKIFGLSYSIMRYGSLYGKRANHFNFINNVIHQAILNGKIVRSGDGSEIRDYINVSDAARTSVQLLNSQSESEYVMITGNQTLKIKDLLTMIKEIFDNNIEIEYTNEKLEEHYEITPYTFKPKVAKKYILDYYHDLGQGILESVYDVYNELAKENDNLKIERPKSAEY